MLGNGKNRGVGNILLALLCILLFVLFAGLIVWSSKEDAEESKRLQELAKTEKSTALGAQQEDIQTKSPIEDAEEALEEEDAQEESLEEDTEEEIPARGIVCWGDDLINGEDSATYSYKVILQNHLNENGYELPVLDKTIQGGGTLSMMTMAGVPAEEVQVLSLLIRKLPMAVNFTLQRPESGI